MSDSEDLFNFVVDDSAINRNAEEQRKRVINEGPITTNYSFVKKPAYGYKIIRIEIHDARNFENTEDTFCKCKAELCAQHVVRGVLFDEIYTSTKEIISKIQHSISNNAYSSSV